jgi:hypothetical protein
MLSKITMPVPATAVLPFAIASPALAQRGTEPAGGQAGVFRGHPLPDWYRADS